MKDYNNAIKYNPFSILIQKESPNLTEAQVNEF